MHIVMLGPFGLHPKGTMRARALPAARALVARGHRVTVLMPPWHTPGEGGRVWEDASGVRLEYIPLGGLNWPALGHLIVAWRLARRTLALAPEVVHVFKPKGYGGLAAALLRLRGGRPPLVMDTDDWEGPGGWNELEPYTAVQRRFFTWQERWGLVHADGVTVASRALQTLVWSLGVPPEQVSYLPNAIDDAEGLPPAVPLAGETGADLPGEKSPPPTLLLYTRFFEYDLARPLAVLARVRQVYPHARLVVIGRGLAGEEADFQELARRQGLAEAVDYRGWVDAAALPAHFARCDVALYPFDDNLVNRTKSAVKLLELLAAGLPVVAEAVGQNREVIGDQHCGRLVPPGDVEAFARAVIQLLADPAARQAVGRAARERIRSRFVWSRQVATLEEAYASAGRVAGAARR